MSTKKEDDGAGIIKMLRRQREAIVRRFRAKLRSRAEAEDATQEVSMRVWLQGKALSIEDPEKYVSRSVTNVATDMWRAAESERRTRASLAEYVESIGESHPDPQIAQEKEEEWRLLLAAIGEMPKDLRDALVLVKFQGLSIKHAAERMRMEPVRLDRQLRKAIRWCREKIEDNTKARRGE